MWYCVIRVADFHILYHGQDRRVAEGLVLPGSHLAEGKRLGDAQRRAAIEVGYIRRGVPVPPYKATP